MKKLNKRAQGFGEIKNIIITIAILLIALIFIAKAGEWMGLWDFPLF